MRLEHSVHIARPVEDVFAYVDDHRRATEWADGLLGIDLVQEAPEGVGTRFRMRIKEGPRESTYDGTVVAHRPREYVQHRIEGHGMTMVSDMRYEVVDGGTRLTHGVEVRLTGFAKLMTPLVWVMNRRTLRQQTANIKALLEARKDAA